MGTVYRAFDRDLNRTVAVKVLRSELVPDLRNLLRLKRELILASRVSHENVVRVHDLGELEGQALLVMDWVDGESLGHLLNRVYKLPPSQVVDFARQIGQALRAIHTANIVHRDLKPGNLLIRKDGAVLVSDFGLARSALPGDITLTTPGELNGTPCYMAPEQLAGLPADARSDFYSLGIVLLRMLTGITILEALTPLRLKLLADHTDMNRRADELVDLAVLEKVIRRCLHPDRTERYPDADALLDDLKPAPLVVVRLSWRRRLRSVIGSRLWRIGLATVILALVPLGYGVLSRHHAAQVAKSAQLYADAIALINPQSAEPELRAALQDLDQSLADNPKNLSAARSRLDALIGLYERTSDVQWLGRARAALASATTLLPIQEHTLFQARIDLDAGLFQNVIRTLESDSALRATSEHANRLLGRALEASNRTEAAFECYRAAVRLSPESWRARNELGYALLGHGRLEDARKEFLRVTELRPDSPVGHLGVGAALLDLGSLSGAREHFEIALERMPSPEAYYNLGVTDYYARQYATAIPFFEAALRMQPDSDLYVAALGDSLRHLHRIEGARAAYSRVLALLEQRKRVRPLSIEEESRRAVTFARLGDRETARSILDAIPLDSVTQDVAFARAVLAALEGQRAASRRHLTEAVQNGYPARLVELDPDFDNVH